MLTFDKLKIVTAIDHIHIKDEGQFVTTEKNGIVISKKYEQKKPFELLISISEVKKELALEFTGKLLGDRYNELINQHNIRHCFERINAMGFCYLNTEAIIEEGKVVKCDVTFDMEYDGTVMQLKNYINPNLKNNVKWTIGKYKGGNGFVLTKNVITTRNKVRISIYNKKKEMQRANNRAFLETVANPDELLRSFENKTRIELNIVSKQAIQERLHTENVSLTRVLSADANPIKDAFNEALVESGDEASFSEMTPHNFLNTIHTNKDMRLDEVGRLAILILAGGNMRIVETIIREHTSKNTSNTLQLQKFREIMSKYGTNKIPTFDIRGLLRESSNF